MSLMSNWKTEEEICDEWDDKNVFQQSLNQTNETNNNNPEYVFYDGPPFATGLPHYGHLVASTIKDIFGRYKTQTGHYVERRWGWGKYFSFLMVKRSFLTNQNRLSWVTNRI